MTLLRWIKPDEGRIAKAVPLTRKTAKAAVLPSSLPGIVMAKGMKIARTREFYRTILVDFLENHSDSAEEIRSLIDADDIPVAIRAAHTMKSTSGTIGAVALQDAARKLEELLNSRDMERCAQVLEEYSALLKEVTAGLHAAFSADLEARRRIPVAGDKKVDITIAAPILEEIAECMDCDIVRTQELMKKLHELLEDTALATLLNQLEGLVKRYEMEEAEGLVRRIKAELGISESAEGGR